MKEKPSLICVVDLPHKKNVSTPDLNDKIIQVLESLERSYKGKDKLKITPSKVALLVELEYGVMCSAADVNRVLYPVCDNELEDLASILKNVMS